MQNQEQRLQEITSEMRVPKGQPLVHNKMYLQLFHGRDKPNRNMNDWGSIGPIFGPLNYFQFTYGTMRLGGERDEMELDMIRSVFEPRPGHALERHEDLIKFEGVYYGDFSVFVCEPGSTPEVGT